MADNNTYSEKEPISNFPKNQNKLNNSYIQPLKPMMTNKNQISFNNNSHSYKNIPNLNNSNINRNNPNIPYDNNYIKDRYTKVKEENADLKKKLFDLEKDYKIQKGQMEEKVLVLRDENSTLQIQLQKVIEKQKEIYKTSDNIYNENKLLLNKLNIVENEAKILRDDMTRKNAEIEEKTKIINDLLNEKNLILNEEKNMKEQIESLNKDKEVLIQQIQELNMTIGEKIAPKLKMNENNLVNLQEQIENLRINNEKYKSDNSLLFNENKIQKNLIKILTKQNKKLLGEIKIIYDRDILLMDNMEKMGSNNSKNGENFKNLYYKNSNDNLFEEELSILKQSQKYLIDDENEKENYILDTKNAVLNTFQNSDKENNYDDINKNNNDKERGNSKINKNILNKNKINKNNKINEVNNSSFINNEIIVKRSKESIEQQNNINNKISNKNLYNNNLTDDINKEKLSLKNTNMSAHLLNTGLNKNIKKEKNIKNKDSVNEYNTEKNNNRIRFENLDDDIKMQNKLFISEDSNNEKNRYTNNYFYHYNNNDIINDDHMYSTDGKVNIKNNGNIKIDNNEKNNNEKEYINTNISNKEMNLYKISSVHNDDNNMLQSQAKSLLSEYVEDLEVLQDKENNI